MELSNNDIIIKEKNNKLKFNKKCDTCNFEANTATEWIKHVKSQKHQRGGLPKSTECNKCDYKCVGHWLLKRHVLTQHDTIEDRRKQKYYCDVCDYVFFSKLYMDKHLEGRNHKLKVEAYGL